MCCRTEEKKKEKEKKKKSQLTHLIDSDSAGKVLLLAAVIRWLDLLSQLGTFYRICFRSWVLSTNLLELGGNTS